MALQHPFSLPCGIDIPTAYHRVSVAEQFRIARPDGNTTEHVRGLVDIYKDATSRDQGLMPVQSYQFQVSGDAYTNFFSMPILDQTNVNVYVQSYAWVKTQTNLNGIDYTHDSTDV